MIFEQADIDEQGILYYHLDDEMRANRGKSSCERDFVLLMPCRVTIVMLARLDPCQSSRPSTLLNACVMLTAEPLVISLAVRLCFEMGLHRSETYQRSIKDEDDQAAAVATFWSVYVLERRSSMGFGVPFIMQDSDIDLSLPRPVSRHILETVFFCFAQPCLLTRSSPSICTLTQW